MGGRVFLAPAFWDCLCSKTKERSLVHHFRPEAPQKTNSPHSFNAAEQEWRKRRKKHRRIWGYRSKFWCFWGPKLLAKNLIYENKYLRRAEEGDWTYRDCATKIKLPKRSWAIRKGPITCWGAEAEVVKYLYGFGVRSSDFKLGKSLFVKYYDASDIYGLMG